ncbi:PP2C family protein-serine/threonine phosphatase [Oscillatoria amoena NRMC-F 0135]|nr:PP2C family protein-serine/threonine phosphatase [Oscillatoria amoena NRMC-F 0135]
MLGGSCATPFAFAFILARATIGAAFATTLAFAFIHAFADMHVRLVFCFPLLLNLRAGNKCRGADTGNCGAKAIGKCSSCHCDLSSLVFPDSIRRLARSHCLQCNKLCNHPVETYFVAGREKVTKKPSLINLLHLLRDNVSRECELLVNVKEIRCAEIWGGSSAAQEDLSTRGLTAALYSRSSDGAKGGDIYYFSVCSIDILTRVVIADLRGHGEAVSHLSHWLYEQMLLKMDTLNGAAILEELNNVVCEKGFQAMTTAVVVSYNQQDRKLHYAYAGHPPILLRHRGCEWTSLEADHVSGPANLPLGVMKAVPYVQKAWSTAAGERLVLYTDGLLECPSPAGEDFEIDRLQALLKHNGGLNAHELRNKIVEELESHHGGSLDHDDCTVAILDLL